MEYQLNSRSNPRVKNLLKNREHYFFFEGEKLVQDILNRGKTVSILIINSDKVIQPSIPPTASIEETWIVNREVMTKISTLKEAPGYIAVMKWQEDIIDFRQTSVIIGLDNIQDPGNVGTVFRCATAFGVDTIALTGNSVTLNNSKFLRAAQHTFLEIKCRRYDTVQTLIQEAEKAGINVYLTSSHDSKQVITPAQVKQPALIILGNEGNGLEEELLNQYPSVKIPQTNRVESLNVGISACIIMYELSRSGESSAV